MAFDQCRHEKIQMVMKAGNIIRALRGLPEETNINKLVDEFGPALGFKVDRISSRTSDRIPEEENPFKSSIPAKECPTCGGTMFLDSICPACNDSIGPDGEKGFYKSGYQCRKCGRIEEKNEMFWSERMHSMGREIPEGMKKRLGIRTITDEGSK